MKFIFLLLNNCFLWLSLFIINTQAAVYYSKCPQSVRNLEDISCDCRNGERIQILNEYISPYPVSVETKFFKVTPKDNLTGRFLFNQPLSPGYKAVGYVALVLGYSQKPITIRALDLDRTDPIVLNLMSNEEANLLEKIRVHVKAIGTDSDLTLNFNLSPGLKDVQFEAMAWNEIGYAGQNKLSYVGKCIPSMPWSPERVTVKFDKLKNKLQCSANTPYGTVCGQCGLPNSNQFSETILLKKISINNRPKIYSLPPFDVLKGPVFQADYQSGAYYNNQDLSSMFDLSLSRHKVLVRLRPCYTKEAPIVPYKPNNKINMATYPPPNPKVQYAPFMTIDPESVSPHVNTATLPTNTNNQLATDNLVYSLMTVLSFTKRPKTNNQTYPSSTPRIEPAVSSTKRPEIPKVEPVATAKPSPYVPNDAQCGVKTDIQNDNFMGLRVIGGQRSPAHAWPWQIIIASDLDTVCSGSIIRPNVILTAAHCFLGLEVSYIKKKFKVIAGLQKVDYKDAKETNKQILKIKDVYSHKDFQQRGSAFDNDIALVVLKGDFKFDQFVSPVCIPPQTLLSSFKECVVSGWGETRDDKTRGHLNHLPVPLINSKKCNETGIMDGAISKNMFCAGYLEGGKDACHGDSGGPLVCLHMKRWHVVGIVSWGINCAQPNKPGVYAHVIKFLPWLKKSLNKIT